MADVLVVTPFNAQVREIDNALSLGRHRRGAGGHGRQIPGSGGAGGRLLDGLFVIGRMLRVDWSSSSICIG